MPEYYFRISRYPFILFYFILFINFLFCFLFFYLFYLIVYLFFVKAKRNKNELTTLREEDRGSGKFFSRIDRIKWKDM